jgi:hypothetical protein
MLLLLSLSIIVVCRISGGARLTKGWKTLIYAISLQGYAHFVGEAKQNNLTIYKCNLDNISCAQLGLTVGWLRHLSFLYRRLSSEPSATQQVSSVFLTPPRAIYL